MSKHHKLLTMHLLKEKEVCASLNWLGEPLGTDYQLLRRWMQMTVLSWAEIYKTRSARQQKSPRRSRRWGVLPMRMRAGSGLLKSQNPQDSGSARARCALPVSRTSATPSASHLSVGVIQTRISCVRGWRLGPTFCEASGSKPGSENWTKNDKRNFANNWGHTPKAP